MQRSNPAKMFFAAPMLALLISVLLVVIRLFNIGGCSSPYIITAALEILIFGVPSALFCAVHGSGYLKKIRLTSPGRENTAIIALGILLLILQSCALKFGIFGFGYNYSSYTLYGISYGIPDSALSTLLMIFSLAFLPAVTEEFLFRGIVLREYRISGLFCSVIMSSLLSAIIYFDLREFIIYFLGGMLLALIVFLSGSVISAMIIHFIYNLFVLFAEKYIWQLSSNPDSRIIFRLIIISLYLFCLFFFIGISEKTLKRKAENGEDAPPLLPKEKRKYIYFDMLTSAPLIADVAVFLTVSIIAALK